MREIRIVKNGQEVVEVRSDGGKLLYIKTEQGYEMMCPRTKQICLVRYEDMYSDCFKYLKNVSVEENSRQAQCKEKNDHA